MQFFKKHPESQKTKKEERGRLTGQKAFDSNCPTPAKQLTSTSTSQGAEKPGLPPLCFRPFPHTTGLVLVKPLIPVMRLPGTSGITRNPQTYNGCQWRSSGRPGPLSHPPNGKELPPSFPYSIKSEEDAKIEYFNKIQSLS